jgi:hypothetical protein
MNRQYKEIELRYRKSLKQILDENPEYLRQEEACDTNQKKQEKE